MDIYCVNQGRYIDVQGGETLLEVSRRTGLPDGFKPICALVNNKTEGLHFPLFAPKQVEFLDIRSKSGKHVYMRSLCMLLYRAVVNVMPETRLHIAHSMSQGHYCVLRRSDSDEPVYVDDAIVARLKEEMMRLVRADLPFDNHEILTKDAIELFRSEGLNNKVTLLETTHQLYTNYYTLDGVADSYYAPLAPSTGLLDVFDLVKCESGFLLMPPSCDDLEVPAVPLEQHKMYNAFKDYIRFNRVIGVSTVGELNRAVIARHTPELINVAEAMHERYLGRISDEIAARHADGGARVVMIAGPSSSGKTTTAKRLAIQLMTNLLVPKLISLDNYFVDRHDTPKDESGDYDYEHLHALDLPLLNEHLDRLLSGEEINLPTYSFELGRRIEKKNPLRLNKNDVLVIEGIHGLNPELITRIGADQIYKIYVSALTTLTIDDHNWIPTTDNRLLRRIVRDNKYRHTTALDTIRRWDSVRRGEERWIFPYQENADAMFNSSLLFELGVMKNYAVPLLQGVPHDEVEYATAHRLLRFLDLFEPIPAEQIPTTSLLREFLGGSSFRY